MTDQVQVQARADEEAGFAFIGGAGRVAAVGLMVSIILLPCGLALWRRSRDVAAIAIL